MQKFFGHQIIKGKIAETIFSQMFQDTKKFTVMPFGYDAVMPGLIQSAWDHYDRELLEPVRNAPDFALIPRPAGRPFLVEVKYHGGEFDLSKVQEVAASIQQRWKSARLFYATPRGFFYDACIDLKRKGAEPSRLRESVVPESIQEKWLGLLNEFIKRGNP